MFQAVYEKKFEKDLKRELKRNKDLTKIKFVINSLIEGKKLPIKFCDHSLKGNFANCRECHIEPDWLLIYMYKQAYVIFIRTGSHSDLFR